MVTQTLNEIPDKGGAKRGPGRIFRNRPVLADADPAKFRGWLSVFFAERGHYSVSNRAIGAFAPPIQSEKARAGAKERARATIDALLQEGKAQELLQGGYIKPSKSWAIREDRVAAVRAFVDFRDGRIRDLQRKDFYDNGLRGLLARYHESPYAALVEAGYAHSYQEAIEHAGSGAFDERRIYPWEMGRTPYIFEDPGLCRAAVIWLLCRCKGKQPTELTEKDFESHGLRGLTARFDHPVYEALVMAGIAFSPGEIEVQQLRGDFRSDKVYPWELKCSPQIYHLALIRSAAVRWLSRKADKAPRDITLEDFERNCLAGLLSNHFQNSPYLALREAGLVSEADEGYMKRKDRARLLAQTRGKTGYPIQ
ncbi:MAG: hypothetical protein V1827_00815 [Candidatus Micrarchaeota archaeon]